MASRSASAIGAFGVITLLLAALSFRVWFRYDVDGESAARGSYVLRHSVNAWQGSTLWTYAVVLGVSGVVKRIHLLVGYRSR